VSCLLQQRHRSPCASWKMVGLVDDAFGDLPQRYSSLVDDVSPVWNPTMPKGGAVYIDGSPMTHSPHLTTRFMANPAFLSAAVIYDFIPIDWPGYLPSASSRAAYFSKIARLRNFDLYFPISEYSGLRLAQIINTPPARAVVTGASVRSTLYDVMRRRPIRRSPYETERPYFFSLGGGDRRKNTEAAVAAVRELNATQGTRIGLKVVGHYDPTYRADIMRAAGHADGAGFLEFRAGVDDETLADLYSGAIATICPSHIEGFDLPVIESAVCGTPVIASTCGAHLELVKQRDALFPSGDYRSLVPILSRILLDRTWRDELVSEQAPMAAQFHEERVGSRFWSAIAAPIPTSSRMNRVRGHRPKVAFLSPYPPDQSGVAFFTQLTIEAATPHLNVDLYTDAPRPLGYDRSCRDAGKISSAALLRSDYDGIISVLGNSHFHIPVFEFLEEYGGPCILHDSRLTHIYHHRLGAERFLEFASSILGRSVGMDEVQIWLDDREFPSLFVERVLKRAKPLIVHTAPLQSLLRERYSVEAQLATFCPNLFFTEEDLTQSSRAAARERLGIKEGVFLVSTFGFVAREKKFESCIVAAEMLRGWKIPAELHFVGSAGGIDAEIARIANQYGISAHVHSGGSFIDSRTYRDFLLASDAAIQLRKYGLGQASGALADCISAAMPCVASDELALACDAPDYILTVPRRSSPLQVAEQLATIWESGRDRALNKEARLHYLEFHNYRYYVQRLREILDI
jgi:glycosyltransferase involved in cell wall biosynthesis